MNQTKQSKIISSKIKKLTKKLAQLEQLKKTISKLETETKNQASATKHPKKNSKPQMKVVKPLKNKKETIETKEIKKSQNKSATPSLAKKMLKDLLYFKSMQKAHDAKIKRDLGKIEKNLPVTINQLTQTDETDFNQFLGKIFQNLLIPECIVVDTNVETGEIFKIPVLKPDQNGDQKVNTVDMESLPIKILIRSLEKDDWTESQKLVLPDGIRELHSRNYVVKMFDEPLKSYDLIEMLVERHFFCEGYNYGAKDVIGCIVTTRNPSKAILQEMNYKPVCNGIYRTETIFFDNIQIISINQLQNQPWNAAFKLFSSNKQECAQAINVLKERGVFDIK